MSPAPGPDWGKTLLVIGLVIAAVGLGVMLWKHLGLPKVPLGKLPGDITIDRPGFKFSFPIVTCLVISVVLSLVLWLFRK